MDVPRKEDMKRKVPGFLILLLFASPLLGQVVKGWMARIMERRRDQTLKRRYVEFGGHKRSYLLHEPFSKPPKDGYPIVFVIHGGGGLASGMSVSTAMHSHSIGKKYLVVYPDSLEFDGKKNWADGRTATVPGREAFAKVDDVGFICFILDGLIKEYAVNQKRVFATGVSNGAFMSHRLAAEKADRFAAIAPVIGGMAESVAKKFKPTMPLSVLQINGTEDPLVPYEGGYVHFRKQQLGKTLPVTKIIDLWVKHNGCQEKPIVEELKDADPNDGCKVTSFTFSRGKGDSKVILLKISGGGHNWPGARKYAPEFLIGKTCQDFMATDSIIRFFEQIGTTP